MRHRVPFIAFVLVALTARLAFGQASPTPGPQQPARDKPAQQVANPPATPQGAISGHVLTVDTGRPVKRARVLVTSPDLPQGRSALTDDTGAFAFSELPAGRYSVTVSKSGFITIQYGQRRPLQPGTPLQLADGQQLKSVDFRLPRGGAISGRVMDEDGEPMPGASVRVMRYDYAQGSRQLVPVGTGQTDDRGVYRVWALQPGEYYVSATGRLGGGGGGPFGPGGPFGFGPGIGGGRGGAEPEPVGYAPTYYPGTSSVTEARPVTLGLSQEADNIDFGLQLVRTSKISGRVVHADGTPSSSGNVTLSPEGTAIGGGGGGRGGMAMGGGYAARIDWDGAFTIASVPPGRYILRARSDSGDVAMFAAVPLTVAGADISGVAAVVSGGATISGTVVMEPGRSGATADPSAVRLSAPSIDQSNFGRDPVSRVEKDGTFTIDNVPAGWHLFRANGAPRGWYLKSFVVDGRDTTDLPLEVRNGQKVTGVRAIFSDQMAEITGTVTTDQNVPVPDYTVLAFPVDPELWRPQSRHIATARPDQNGKFQIRGLPPGQYYVATVDPTTPGEWFDPTYLDTQRQNAERVTLSDGDAKTQNFKIALR